MQATHNMSVLQEGFSLLKFCNIQFEERGRLYPFLYKIPCTIICYISLTMYLAKFFKGEILFEDMSLMVSVHAVCNQVFYRVAVLVSMREEIRATTAKLAGVGLKADLSEEQIIKKNVLVDRLNFRYAVLYWIIMIGAWQYLLLPLLTTLLQIFVIKQDSNLLLPIMCVYPFDPTKDWFRYLLIYAIQVYWVVHLVMVYLGVEIMLMAYASYLSMEFQLLQDDFENLRPDSGLGPDSGPGPDPGLGPDHGHGAGDHGGTELRALIRRHQLLLELAEDIDNVFNGVVFMNLSASTIMVSFFLVATLVTNDVNVKLKNYIAVLAGTYPLYSMCFHSEMLKEASLGVGDAAYRSDWYKGTGNYRRAIKFIIMRSQKPCSLTSMKYSRVTLQTFMSFVSSTWSYFSLALTMYEDK